MTDVTTNPGNSGNSGDLDEFLGAPAQRPWRKWGIRAAIGLVLLLVILLLARCFGGEVKPNYTTREARLGDLVVTVSATGNLKPINQVDVGSEQSGLITDVFVDVNDRVTRGQVLAELDTSRLRDDVSQGQSQVAASNAGVAQAQAQEALARATLNRQEEVFRLSGGKVPSKTELDTARANYRQAQAQVRSAQAQVQVSRAQLATAQTNLSKARILSPVNGVVLSRDIEPGQTVASGLNVATLFTIAEDLQQMEVEVSVDEADVGQVKQGQDATFTVDAFPGKNFPAQITRVNVGSNAASGSSSSSESASSGGNVVAYTAVLSVSNPDETLRPGMTATADIVTKRLQNVLLVPNAALRFNPGQGASTGGGLTSALVPRRPRRGNRAERTVSFGPGSRQTVYVLNEDGTPRPIEVIIGDSDGTRTAIASGDLKAGMRVITGQLAPGQEPPAAERGEDSGQRGERRLREGAGNATAPAVAPTAPNATSAAATSSSAPANTASIGTNPKPDERAPTEPAAPAPDRQRMRDMTPEQRRAYIESLSPEEREAMRQRREARRQQREAQPANAE